MTDVRGDHVGDRRDRLRGSKERLGREHQRLGAALGRLGAGCGTPAGRRCADRIVGRCGRRARGGGVDTGRHRNGFDGGETRRGLPREAEALDTVRHGAVGAARGVAGPAPYDTARRPPGAVAAGPRAGDRLGQVADHVDHRNRRSRDADDGRRHLVGCAGGDINKGLGGTGDLGGRVEDGLGGTGDSSGRIDDGLAAPAT